MSSGDDSNDDVQYSKKRRIQRACDICRRKKGDGGQMPGNRCSNCIAYNFDCTYVEAAKKRGPPKGYVENLESRMEKTEKLLSKLFPDLDLDKELEMMDRDNWSIPNLAMPQCLSNDILTRVIRTAGSSSTVTAGPGEGEIFPNDEQDGAHESLIASMKSMSIDPVHQRFFGKSSGFMLVQAAMDMKREYTGDDAPRHHVISQKFLTSRRPEFWNIRPWELNSAQQPKPIYVFPDDDLLFELVDHYFNYLNCLYPLLHQPTFERACAEGFHLRNDSFAATLLLVCSIGSWYSNDPRIFLEGYDSVHSCGWKWFEQVKLVRKSLLTVPSLYDLQSYCLSVLFLLSSSAPQACWTMVGIGIRLAQDVGAHRRKAHESKLTGEDESWKRAFWVLVQLDRIMSSILGRPCAIQDEDFDLDYPIECDDEYWDHPDPAQAFKQPKGKPSKIAYFNSSLKLNQILAFSLRTIYSINKSKIILGFVGKQWEQQIVSELDSALNKWVDNVPDHLRWDPNRENRLFFDQSAALYASYYHLQILIHRPFIPSATNPSPLPFPSLAICANAARSCSHIVDLQCKRSPFPIPYLQGAVFTSGVVLLLNIWGGKRSGLSTNPQKEMTDVHKCMHVLKLSERRWHSAGRLWDIMYELASVGDLPLPVPSPPSNKRDRDSDSPISSIDDSLTASSPSVPDTPRTIAGSRRVSTKDVLQAAQIGSQGAQTACQKNVFTLPVYSNQLGRLPLHGQVDFSKSQAMLLDPTNNYWYTAATNSQMPASVIPHSQSLVHSRSGSLRGLDKLPASFTMDELYFDQIASNFSAAFQTPDISQLQYQSNPEGVHIGPEAFQSPQYYNQQSTASTPSLQSTVDSDTMGLWSNVPPGFELDDWGTYLLNVRQDSDN